jgi:hypothetical protein
MKYIAICITIVMLLTGCQKFCTSAHESMKKGTAGLEQRWACQPGCLYQKVNYLVDGSVCKLHQDASPRLAASLVCTAAVDSLALLGGALIAKACKCQNGKTIFTDLSAPANLCFLFALLP